MTVLTWLLSLLPRTHTQAVAFFIKNIETKSYHFFNIDILESQLRRARQARPTSVKLYNQLANYWRIKGDTGKSIDCFRSALILDPANADVLHDLARVLFALQYYDDAIYLVRRSLESQPSNQNRWRALFTLGEIYRSYGQFQQSIAYFRQALDLYPGHEPILKAIKSMEEMSATNVQQYTIIIILLLVSWAPPSPPLGAPIGSWWLTRGFFCLPCCRWSVWWA